MISALDPECGKTNLMEIISHITYDGYLCDRGTVSSILLAIDTYRPTLLLDEAGRYLKDMFFRETINSGYQRGKLVMKTKNNGQEFVVYEVFTPIVLGGLKLWDTLAEDTQTRCLKIILDKSEKVGEVPHIKHLDTTKLDILAQKAAKFVLDNLQKLRDYDLPSREGRLGNNWEPLFAVAEAVGNGWVERATLAMERAKQTNSKHKTEWVRYLSFTRDWFILNPKQDKIWVIAHQG
jgi:hypothetical protein